MPVALVVWFLGNAIGFPLHVNSIKAIAFQLHKFVTSMVESTDSWC